jgi:hypothetical protein
MIKLFKPFNVEKGSTRPSLPTEKLNVSKDRLVNAGKSRELGKVQGK